MSKKQIQTKGLLNSKKSPYKGQRDSPYTFTVLDGGFYGIDLKQIKSKAFSAVSGPDGSALQYKKKFTKIRVPGGPYGGPKVAPKGVTLQKMVFERGVQSIRNDLIRLETLS